MPLFEALAKRRSSREFSPDAVPMDVLSNLLWAANGLKEDGEYRTAPSGKNQQAIDLYVIDGSGAYLFDYKRHGLKKITDGDLTAAASDWGAPLSIALVADQNRQIMPDSTRLEAGYISQNIYLAATSLGLASVVQAGSFDREAIEEKLGLGKNQDLMLIHAVGYPKR